MAKLKPLNEIIESDCCKLLLKEPFIANVLLSLKLEINNNFQTAATDGEKIFINENFYRSLTPGERMFVLAHETWHVILLHFARRQDRDPHFFNIAADLEIHFQLLSEKFSEPFVLPHNPAWASLSAEEIYDIIAPKKCKSELLNGRPQFGQPQSNPAMGRTGSQIPGEAGKNDKSSDDFRKWIRTNEDGQGEGFDEHIYPSDAKVREQCDKVRVILHRAISRFPKSIGKLPAGFKALLNDFLKPQVNWRTELKQFVTQCFGGSRRWLPPARRYVSQGLYLPSYRDSALNAVVALDTSGSTQEYLPVFFTELKSLLHTFGSFEITLIQCDCAIQKVEKFTDNVPSSFEVSGLGGTSFIPPFEYVKEKRLTPSVFIYITDGYGKAPQNPPPYPVLWLLTPDGADTFITWGRKIRMKPLKETER